MDYKEMWSEIYEDLEEKLGREPGYDEVREAFLDEIELVVGCFRN